jgi:hypothetical protein
VVLRKGGCWSTPSVPGNTDGTLQRAKFIPLLLDAPTLAPANGFVVILKVYGSAILRPGVATPLAAHTLTPSLSLR